MALVKYGGGIVQMSGSIAGNTHARNRYGNYVRARTKPVNPSTALQQAVRSAMSQLTTRWGETLTPVQRTAWNLYGSGVAMKNKLGEIVYCTGHNHFIRGNAVRLQLGGALVDDGPTLFELPETDSTAVATGSEATQLISIAFDDALAWLDENEAWFGVWMGSPQNPQRNFFKGPWRFAGSVEGDSVTPPTTPQTFAAPFVMTEGQRVWVYMRITRADGRVSEKFMSSFFCAA